MKYIRFLTGFFSVLFLTATALGANIEEDVSNPEEKAKRAHDLAMSDVIYEQENFKALYYQNVEILQVLKEIRDQLHAINMRDAKNG